MIVLDTNVISESWKIAPNPHVLAWLDAQAVQTLYLSVITVAELRYGITTMPEGKRRTLYQNRLSQQVLPLFADRMLAFDLNASERYAELMAQARGAGKSIGRGDGYIAATAAAHDFAVATRDTQPFLAVGLTVINPWEAVDWH